MPGNTIGQSLVLTTYGESHGFQIGGILDEYARWCRYRSRPCAASPRPSSSRAESFDHQSATKRTKSPSTVAVYSKGKTTGTPIAFSIPNKDQRSKDYGQLKDVYRPSHADFTYDAKYGHRDYRGGGRSSARETACRVVAGALAAQILPQVSVKAWVSAVGPIALQVPTSELDLAGIDDHPTRCPHPQTAEKMEAYIEQCRAEKDSTGGVITAVASGVPVGLGEPVFDKLQADLAKALMSINAVKGFEIGSGFAAAAMRGSTHNDAITEDFKTTTNHAGGVVGD